MSTVSAEPPRCSRFAGAAQTTMVLSVIESCAWPHVAARKQTMPQAVSMVRFIIITPLLENV